MFAFLLMLFAWAAPSIAQPQPAVPEVPIVVTSGEGIVRHAPDRAWVTISAESRAKTPPEAQRLNAEVMSAVMQKLKGTGLPAEAIQTSAYDLQPEYDYVNNRQTLRGYVARNSIEVRVDTLPKLGEIIDVAVGVGASAVSGIRFDLKDRAEMERAALQKAVADARERANALASGAGMKIERVLKIEDSRVMPMPPPRPMVAARAEVAQSQATPVAPGEIEIRALVTLTAAIR